MKLFKSTYWMMTSLLGLIACQSNQNADQTSGNGAEVSHDTVSQEVETDYVGIYTETAEYQEFKDCRSMQVYPLAKNDNMLSSQFDSLGISQGSSMFVRFNGRVDSTGQTNPEGGYNQQIRVSEVLEASVYEGQSACQPSREETFKFMGNEPFWSLTISADSIIFNHFERSPLNFPYSPPQWQDSAWVFEGEQNNQTLTAYLAYKTCHDSMSGTRYAMRVVVRISEETFEGCGGWERRKKTNEEG